VKYLHQSVYPTCDAIAASEFNMKILANSIPKSGTYLLAQLLSYCGYKDSGRSFLDHGTNLIGSRHELLSYEASQDLNRLLDISEQSYAPCHLTYSLKLASVLSSHPNLKMLFIYRHPGDVLVSYMRFVTYSPSFRSHSLDTATTQNNYQLNFSSDEERLIHIFSQAEHLFGFKQNIGWLSCGSVLCLRFEDLYSDLKLLSEGVVGRVLKTFFTTIRYEPIEAPSTIYKSVFGKGPTYSDTSEKLGQMGFFEKTRLDPIFRSAEYIEILDAYGYAQP
jgi:hypothetical protein